MKRRTFLAWAPLATLAPGALHAADFPAGPVKLVHAYPGGLVDNAARTLANALTSQWAQPVVVEGKPGANELIAGDSVAKAPKDGTTLMLASEAVMVNNLYLYQKLPFDPLKDLVPVSELFQIRFALVTRGNLPANTLAEFVSLMKTSGASHTYASSGQGGPLHLAMEGFRRTAGFEMLHVPYKTLPQLAQDLLGGRVDAVFVSAPFAVPFLASGQLKMLAITGQGRHPAAPAVPTFAELGFAGVDYNTSIGLVAPAGTPPEVLTRIGNDVRGVVRSEAFGRTFLQPNGIEAVASDGAQYTATLIARRATTQRLIRELGIRLE